MFRRWQAVFIVAAVPAFLAPSAAQTTRYVPASAGTPGYDTIQAAIDAATPGNTVLVHPGVYAENIDFVGKAIIVTGTAPTDPAVVAVTVIDGGASGSVVTFASGEGPGAVLRGLTITNGKALEGGGVHCSTSSPTIQHCAIVANAAVGGGAALGGGVYWYDSSPTLSNCTIAGNTSEGAGGGIAGSTGPGAGTATGCNISGNTAAEGGGVWFSSCSPALANCTVTRNSAAVAGGGVCCVFYAFPSVSQCTISHNSAPQAEECTVSGTAPPF